MIKFAGSPHRVNDYCSLALDPGRLPQRHHAPSCLERDRIKAPARSQHPAGTFNLRFHRRLPEGKFTFLDLAGFGSLVINKAISITSEGAVAGITASSGIAIAINAGANDIVNLRGLSIEGSNSGTMGIQFNSGQALNIQKSVIRSFTGSGINFDRRGQAHSLLPM